MISIKENGINKPEDIIGKKIGITEGDGPAKLFKAFLQVTGIDESKVKLIAMNPTGKVGALLNKRVDAILGGFDDQPFQIKEKGYEPTIIVYADYGVNCIGMSLVAHNDTIKSDPDLLKRFVQAYAESWAAAYKNPEAALDSLIKRFPDLNRKTCINQLNAAFECLISKDSIGIANIDEKAYKESIELFKKYMGLSSNIQETNLYTTQFMPSVIKLEK